MAFEIDLNILHNFLNIERERNLAMKEISEILGYDISFSEEEIQNNALEAYSKYISKEINKEVETWMKSLFSKT